METAYHIDMLLNMVSRSSGRKTAEPIGGVVTWRSGVTATYPREDPSQSWHTLNVQRRTALDMPFTALIQYAIDLSPELSKALADFQRFCNPARRVDNRHASGERGTLAFIAELDRMHGSFSSHCDTMFSSIFTTGALFLELILDSEARRPVDIAIVDPMTVEFRTKMDSERGNYPALYQYQNTGNPVDLSDYETVKYVAFDNLVGSPYGRPLIGGSVYAAMMLLGIIRDAQRVIANAGLSRMDYEVDVEELLRIIDRNPDIAGDDVATAQFIEDQLDTIKTVLEGLKPDDAFVHTSTVKVNYATNPMQLNTAGLTDTIQNLQRQIATGAKTYSILQNINDSTADTYAIRQMESYIAAIAAVQEDVAGVLDSFFDLANHAQGIRSESQFAFLKQRILDKKTLRETEQLEIENIARALELGWLTDAEARERYHELRDPLTI